MKKSLTMCETEEEPHVSTGVLLCPCCQLPLLVQLEQSHSDCDDGLVIDSTITLEAALISEGGEGDG